MADDAQPDLSELIVLQRRSLATIERVIGAVRAPRRVTVSRDTKGAITGAVSSVQDGPDDEIDETAEFGSGT